MLHRQDGAIGAALVVASGLLFASMGAAIKLAAATLNNEMIVCMRNAVGVVLLIAVAGIVALRRRAAVAGPASLRPSWTAPRTRAPAALVCPPGPVSAPPRGVFRSRPTDKP